MVNNPGFNFSNPRWSMTLTWFGTVFRSRSMGYHDILARWCAETSFQFVQNRISVLIQRTHFI